MPEPKTIPTSTPSQLEELKIDPLDVRDDKFDPEDEYRPEPPSRTNSSSLDGRQSAYRNSRFDQRKISERS